MKRVLQNCVIFLASTIFILLILEMFLSFLPVQTGLNIQPVNEDQKYFKAKPSSRYTFSRNWNMALANTGKINAQGFIHDADYVAKSTQPLLAIFGDSYVEALMVPFENTLTGRLHDNANSNIRAYSFAFSGAPLSQYLAWAMYARDQFKPDAAVFIIIGNDFDESLFKYKQGPGFFHFQDDEMELTMVRNDYTIGHFRPIIVKSALLRYLFFNLEIQHIPAKINQWISHNPTEKAFENNKRIEVSNEKLELSKRAVAFFLNNVEEYTGLKKEKILFVTDGLRRQIYGDTKSVRMSYVETMFRHFIQSSKDRGFNVIDGHDVLAKEYAIHKKRFEFDIDFHWNGYAHGVIANAIKEHSVFKNIGRIQ